MAFFYNVVPFGLRLDVVRLGALLLAFLCCASWARAEDKKSSNVEPIQEFSADVVRKGAKDNNGTSRGRMYVGRDGVRTEGERMGQSVWMIFRPREKRMWMLSPTTKEYTESEGLDIARPPLPDEPESPCRKDRRFVCREMGVQSVGGRETRLWDISLRSDQGGVKPYGRMWVDRLLRIAVRELYVDGLEVTLENIRIEPQAGALFEVPEGFKKVQPASVAGGTENK
ncbi:MAG: hypothetical protein HQL74_11685 [Magnetococcales bacterium]|nr:hypothetical protein [Magnetococcales bacterium]